MKQMKGLFAEKPASTQFAVLILLVVAGLFFSTLLGGILILTKVAAYPDIMRLVQFIASVGTFLLPALGMAWLCSKNPRDYLSIGKAPGGTVVFYLLLAYLLLSPLMSLTQYLNMQMTLPDFMQPVENWMREQEDIAEEMTLLLLSDSTPLRLLANIFVIAVTAAVVEEFLFRGAVQRVLERRITNPHLVIWITAVLFSAIHLQFYGFIPRLLIGAYLGYLLLWSRNIWIPVFAHFLNNGVAVIGMSNSKLKDMEYFNGELNAEHLAFYILATVVSGLLLIPLFQNLKKKVLKQHSVTL
ncbi:MAG: CPBP family intramembrane metalloprotease [Tannerellaceae bacterium]|jgi:membrane protease YdiL (CAAX protease family)|nr:CPBP family intramembrane metalloprotease [Tannerellaceae bacterium]